MSPRERLNTADTQPPDNPAALRPFDPEWLLVGALLAAPARIGGCGVDARHYADPTLAAVHEAIGEAVRVYGPSAGLVHVNQVILARRDAAAVLRGLGNGAALIDMAGQMTGGDVDYHAAAVLDAARLRAVHSAGMRLVQRAESASTNGANPADILSDVVAELAAAGLTAGPTGAAAVRPDLVARFVAGGSFILDAPATPPAVWGDGDDVLWAAGEPLMLVGPAGVGKTTLTGQLVRARLGIGDPSLLGWSVQPGARRVLYLAMDRPPQIARALARFFGEEDRGVLDERLLVWPGPPAADIAAEPGLLADYARAADADTIVLDSLKDAALKLSEDAVGAGVNRAIQATLVGGCEVITQHHQRKANGGNAEPDTLADVYGSTWLTAGAGSVILLWGQAGDPVVTMKHLKQPAECIGPLLLHHDHAAGRSTIFHEVDLFAVIRGSGVAGLTAQAAAHALHADGSPAFRPSRAEVEKARRRLDRYAADGLIIRKDGARGGGTSAATDPARYFLAARDVS